MTLATITLNGEAHPLALTLDGLAELEDAFGATSLRELIVQIANPTARELSVILIALLRGGGLVDARSRLAGAAIHLGEALQAVSAAMSAASTLTDAGGTR